jgi:hypothetical protein
MDTSFLQTTLENLVFFAGKTAGFWAPLGLGVLAWELWRKYIHQLHTKSLKWVLLQVRIPRDVFKSPAAMEIFFASALFQTGGVGTWYHKYWLGNVPAWFSLELVSIEGRVYFFIRTQEKFRPIIESQIYAQYPQAEVVDVPDYTNDVPPHTKDGDWNMWGCEFVLTKPDPYPIKTYVDYGLDKATGSLEEEQKIDPITPILEFLGSVGKGEQVWFQILVRAANWARYPDPADRFKKIGWQKYGEQLVKELKDKWKPKKEGEFPVQPTKGEIDAIAAVERAITKYGFDTGIRGIYLAQKDKFNPSNITALTGTFKQFNSGNLNGFKPTKVTDFDYPWQDMTGRRRTEMKKELFDAYRQRSYFYPPYIRKPFVLNTEELATIYHFPGRVLETPTFKRIDSKKVEPPQNLPL